MKEDTCTVVLFVTRLHLDRLAPGTLKSYPAAIRYVHADQNGLGRPGNSVDAKSGVSMS